MNFFFFLACEVGHFTVWPSHLLWVYFCVYLFIAHDLILYTVKLKRTLPISVTWLMSSEVLQSVVIQCFRMHNTKKLKYLSVQY